MDPDSYLVFRENVSDNLSATSPTIGAFIALFLAIILLFVSAYISASEIAFFSLSPSEKNELDNGRHASYKRIKNLLADSERLWATLAIANTFVNVVIIISGAYFFYQTTAGAEYSAWGFLLLAVILVFLLLLFGEIIPKIYSVRFPLKFCRKSASFVSLLYVLFKPFSTLFVKSASFVNRMGQMRTAKGLSVDELSKALELTDKKELSEEGTMLEGIIRFGEETAKEIMTSRLDMVDLEITATYSEVLKCIVDNAYSRIPVYQESRDNIKGILYIKDLLPYLQKDNDFKWQSLIRPAYFVPETKMIDDLLRDFQANKIHIAIVVDEFGGTSGIVTMEDIIEEIVGEINDEYDDEERTYVKLTENSYIFEAKTLLSDFYKILKIDPDEFEDVVGDADTLGGLLLELKGEFPVLHEIINYSCYRFEVLEVDSRRILKVKVTRDLSLDVEKKDE